MYRLWAITLNYIFDPGYPSKLDMVNYT